MLSPRWWQICPYSDFDIFQYYVHSSHISCVILVLYRPYIWPQRKRPYMSIVPSILIFFWIYYLFSLQTLYSIFSDKIIESLLFRKILEIINFILYILEKLKIFNIYKKKLLFMCLYIWKSIVEFYSFSTR